MTTSGPTRLVAWVGGHDLAGRGALTEIEDHLTAMMAPMNLLGPRGTFRHSDPTGAAEYLLRLKGHARRDRAESIRQLLFGPAPAPPFVAVVGHLGPRLGAPCSIASKVEPRTKTWEPNLDDFTRLEAEFPLVDGGEAYDHPEGTVLLQGGTRITAAASLAAPYNGYRYDLGAGGAARLGVALMVDSDVAWRGRTRLRIDVLHNANQGPVGWAHAGPTLDVNPVSSKPAAQAFEVAAGPINRYVAFRYRWDGSAAFQVDNAGGYNAGDDDLHLDGRAGDEVLVPGDTIELGGETYRILAGGTGDPPAAEFDVTLDRGLAAAVANNAAVTTVNDGASFKALAAVVPLPN